MKDNFILYTQQYEVLEPLTDEQLGKLLRALYLYARDKEIPVFDDGMLTMAFGFVRMQIDASNAKYEEKREKMRENIKKRWNRQKNTNDTDVCLNNSDVTNDTKVYNGIQKNTNDTDVCICNDSNDSNDSNDRMKEEPSKEASKSKSGVFDAAAKNSQKKSSVGRKSEIDFKAIKDYWNEKHDATNSAMRRLTIMSDQRKNNVRARLREYGGDVSQVYKAIDAAMRSDFMNGKNGKGWIASFDWIMCPTNFPKVLEGNYTDERPAKAPSQGQPMETARPSVGDRWNEARHRQAETVTQQDNKYRVVVSAMLEDLRKNPNNKPARQSLTRFYEAGVLQRLGIDWKPEK